MQTDIYYRDITRSESLEAYLLEKVEGLVEDFYKNDSGAHLTVRVETDRHRTHTRKPSYICEVILKASYPKGIIKVRKTDENFQRCVANTVNALKVILSKQSSLKAQHRRHDPMLEFQPNLENEYEDETA